MICSRNNHIYQIEFICINKECERRLFCKNCPNFNSSCKIYIKTELLTLLEKNLNYYTKDINEYQQVLITLHRNQQFVILITNVQNEIQLFQGAIQLLNQLIGQMKNQYYDVNKIDLYFSMQKQSGPLYNLVQFCKQLEHLSQIEQKYYLYEINTAFKHKENRKFQIYNYKDQICQSQKYENLIMSVALKKLDENFQLSVCKISPDGKIIIILQTFNKYVKLGAWKTIDPEKKIKQLEFSPKIQSFEFSNNCKYIYVWNSNILQLFKISDMKKIWRQKFYNGKQITSVRQGQQNKIIVCFNKIYIQIYAHNKNLQKVFEMKLQDYSYPLNLILTRNKEISNIHLFSLNSIGSSIINAYQFNLKSYSFINQQKQIGVYDRSEMKFKIFDIILPQIILNIVYAIEFDNFIQNVQFKFENQIIYLISDKKFSIIDVQNLYYFIYNLGWSKLPRKEFQRDKITNIQQSLIQGQ
ncbi:hypothetical protein pb186bvf_013961 [Paramecium bursaria]